MNHHHYEHRMTTERREQERELAAHIRAINDGSFGQAVANHSPEEHEEWERRFREWNYGRGTYEKETTC